MSTTTTTTNHTTSPIVFDVWKMGNKVARKEQEKALSAPGYPLEVDPSE